MCLGQSSKIVASEDVEQASQPRRGLVCSQYKLAFTNRTIQSEGNLHVTCPTKILNCCTAKVKWAIYNVKIFASANCSLANVKSKLRRLLSHLSLVTGTGRTGRIDHCLLETWEKAFLPFHLPKNPGLLIQGHSVRGIYRA